jgi:hypothetical protein
MSNHGNDCQCAVCKQDRKGAAAVSHGRNCDCSTCRALNRAYNDQLRTELARASAAVAYGAYAAESFRIAQAALQDLSAASISAVNFSASTGRTAGPPPCDPPVTAPPSDGDGGSARVEKLARARATEIFRSMSEQRAHTTRFGGGSMSDFEWASELYDALMAEAEVTIAHWQLFVASQRDDKGAIVFRKNMLDSKISMWKKAAEKAGLA